MNNKVYYAIFIFLDITTNICFLDFNNKKLIIISISINIIIIKLFN